MLGWSTANRVRSVFGVICSTFIAAYIAAGTIVTLAASAARQRKAGAPPTREMAGGTTRA